MTYDTAGRRSTFTLPNGIVATYGYDTSSRLASLSYDKSGTHVGDLSYVYDTIGRRTSMGGTLARVNLPTALSSATYNANNQLTNWNGTALSYDLNGNMSNDGIRAFSWNARNQLASIGTTTFQYDGTGRRSQNGAGVGFVYDGLNPVQEIVSGTPRANLLAGGLDEFFARTDSGGTSSFLTDALGSTLALADSTATVQTQYTFDPFGNTTSTGASSTNALQYTGRENDGSGTYYYRARYYNATLGRFISEDPVGFLGGQANLYAYVGDDPIDFTDPYGLFGWEDLPTIPQPIVDFVSGASDTLSFGLTNWVRNQMGTNDLVNKCSGSYLGGELTGVGLSTAIGGAAGAGAAEANAGKAGFEFSHWIPARFGGPRSIFNGNYVSQGFHYLTDPFRYPSGWQSLGPKLNPALQQLLRVPWVYGGAAAGAAYGGASMAGRNCGCSN